MNTKIYDAVIIGAGFFGCNLSIYLKKHLSNLLVLEQNPKLLQRASYVNQARVHNGYHYPRSFLTALRSRVNFPRFIQDYEGCVDSSFDSYYAVGKILSKINSQQFKEFCNRINAPIENPPNHILNLFNLNLIDKVYKTQEYAFDAVKLANNVKDRLEEQNISTIFNSTVSRILPLESSDLKVEFCSNGYSHRVISRYVFNCTYSSINSILSSSNLTTIPLKHELTEMALLQTSPNLKTVGITVMCGPFFSFMPFPARGLHTLSHVRYTPHGSWTDTTSASASNYDLYKTLPHKTNFPYMIRDAARYVPSLADCTYVESLWDIKTVLPQSEIDDSRPILFQSSLEAANLISVLGSKIDNIYDLDPALEKFLKSRQVLV